MKTTTEMQLVPITKLVPYVNNARTHSPEQINKLRSSLREFGFINPVIIDRDYGVIAGHGRILAAKEEGITEVPCVFADHLTEAQKKAYYHYTTTNKQPLAAYRCMSRKTQSAVEVPGQTYTPPHKATFNLNASPELMAYRERYCKPPKERPMLCTDIRIPIDLPQKAFCRAWNLIVAKKLRYQATLRSTVDNAEDLLVRYRAEEMCLLIDEIGKITEFSYPLMLKTLDRVVVNTNGKLSFIFQSGIKITV